MAKGPEFLWNSRTLEIEDFGTNGLNRKSYLPNTLPFFPFILSKIPQNPGGIFFDMM